MTKTYTIEDAIALADSIENGAEFNWTKKGATRFVMFFGNYVLKVDKGDLSSFGHNANLAEWDLYTILTDNQRKLFAKPLYITEKGRVLVMERIVARLDVTDDTIPDYDVLWSDIADAFPNNNARCEVQADLHSNNVGWNPKLGRWQVLDYGGWSHCGSDENFIEDRYRLREFLGLIPPFSK